MNSIYAQIIIDLSVENVDKAFSYMIPENLRGLIDVGSVVLVPFGRANKLMRGYVIDLIDSIDVSSDKIKSIDSIAERSEDVESQLIALAGWMKGRYGCTMSRALQTVSPVRSKIKPKENRSINLLVSDHDVEPIHDILLSKRRITWIRIIEYLRNDKNKNDYSSVLHNCKTSAGTLKAMQEEGYISIDSNHTYRNPKYELYRENHEIRLNSEQQNAADIFDSDYANKNYKTYMLYGVTGSGKTEVYSKMISTVLENKRKVIVLVPEISLTYQTIVRLTAVFGNRVAVIHSKLSQGERYDQFQRAKDGDADIMIGPRSALFTPFDDIGLIIIDEEHDSSYKSENIPRYHSVDIAIKRAELSHASLVLSSATPSLDSYTKALSGQYTMLKLTKRAVEGSHMPSIHVVDLRSEMKSGNKSIFSEKLDKLIRDRLTKHEQVILFMNRRGYSNFVSCRSCGDTIMCPHCDISLTLHKDNTLVCHYCGYKIPMPDICPSCGSPYIAAFGTGTQKLETMTKKMYPDARVIRMDADTSSGKDSTRDILETFAAGEADILVGTQMIVKGHDFPNVTLVGIMAADTSLYISDYMSTERTYELIVQASGRSGRGEKSGDVVIQTYNPDHYAIAASAENNYEMFYEHEMSYRKLAGYPPAVHMLTILLSSRKEDSLKTETKRWEEALNIKCTQYKAKIIGPNPAGIYKVNDYYREIIYIKHISYDILLEIKKEVEAELNNGSDRYTSIVYDFT